MRGILVIHFCVGNKGNNSCCLFSPLMSMILNVSWEDYDGSIRLMCLRHVSWEDRPMLEYSLRQKHRANVLEKCESRR